MAEQPPQFGQNIVRVNLADIVAAFGGSLVTSVTGTANQVTVSPVPGVGAVTVSLPSGGTLPGAWHAATGFTVDAGGLTVTAGGVLVSAGNVGIGGAAVSLLTVPMAPTATSNYGLVSLGSGPFDGVTAGFFAGNSNGTHIAVNAVSGYLGRMMDLQTAGVRYFAVGVARASLAAIHIPGGWFTGGDATTTKPQVLVEPVGATSTGWATGGTGLGINAATGATGNLIDAQLNGFWQFRLNLSGGNSGLLELRTRAGGAAAGIDFYDNAGTGVGGVVNTANGTFGWRAGAEGSSLNLIAGNTTHGLTSVSVSNNSRLEIKVASGTWGAQGGEVWLGGNTHTTTVDVTEQHNVLVKLMTVSAATVKTFTDLSTFTIEGLPALAASAAATRRYPFWIKAGSMRYDATTQSTVGAAGGASALPATPAGYVPMFLGTTEYVMAYYAKS